MNSIEKALDCLKNGNRTWEAMGFLQESIKADELTQEVLRQLRAEREALTLQVEEQRRLLERVRVYMCEPAGLTVPRATNKELFMQFLNAMEEKTDALRDDITKHLKGKA